MKPVRLRLMDILTVLGLACPGFATLAQTVDNASAVGPVPATAAQPSDKLAASFTEFAGSTENANALVSGLRTGSTITLTDPVVQPGMPPVSTTFSPGTRPMGYGNIRIALSLARAQLASQGISNPTAEQLQVALVGASGPAGSTQGVLQMRSSGMGWGQIANAQGIRLGGVMSGKQTYAAPAMATRPANVRITTGLGSGLGTTGGGATHAVNAAGAGAKGGAGIGRGGGQGKGKS